MSRPTILKLLIFLGLLYALGSILVVSLTDWVGMKNPQIVPARTVFVFLLLIVLSISLIKSEYKDRIITIQIIKVLNIATFLYIFLDTLSIFILNQNIIDVAKIVFSMSVIFRSGLPFLLVFLITTYLEKGINLVKALPSLYIHVYYLAMIMSPLMIQLYETTNISIYYIVHPFLFNTSILTLAYIVTGFIIIHPIYNNLRGSKFDYSREILVFLLVVIVYFVLIPLVSFIISTQQLDLKYYLTWEELTKIIEFTLLYLLIILFQLGNTLYINLLPQKINRLLIMNRAGLPVLSYDFEKNEDQLRESLILSGSFKAMSSQLSSGRYESRLYSMSLSDLYLLFLFEGRTMYMLQVDNPTMLVESCFKRFKHEFSKRFGSIIEEEKSVSKNYLDIPEAKIIMSKVFSVQL